jgi:hypothetical protein
MKKIKNKYFIYYLYANGIEGYWFFDTKKLYIKTLNRVRGGVWYEEFRHGLTIDLLRLDNKKLQGLGYFKKQRTNEKAKS